MKLATGPEIDSFPLNDAVNHWFGVRKRRLGRLYQSSKPKVLVTQSQAISEIDEQNECAQCDGECEEEVLEECVVSEFIDV